MTGSVARFIEKLIDAAYTNAFMMALFFLSLFGVYTIEVIAGAITIIPRMAPNDSRNPQFVNMVGLWIKITTAAKLVEDNMS